MVESRYWLPCVGEPRAKFSSKIMICVPDGFTVISNGEYEFRDGSQLTDQEKQDNNKDQNQKKKVYIWNEDNPDSTYLISIVIGKSQ